MWAPAGRLLPSATEALVAAGARAEAVELVDVCTQQLRHLDVPLAPAALAYARGVLTASVADFQAAARHYDAVCAPFEAARAREQAATHLHAAGVDGAVELRRAAATYERLGSVWDYHRLARFARIAGIGLPSRHRGGRRGYGAELSPRERAVADLAATGRTNSEIAQELFVSASTVEKHLVAAKRKLRARSRTELANRLAGLDGKDSGFPQ
jgi:DNA-binding CsgD family transcriptional regulator